MLASALALWLFYLVLVDDFSTPELVVGGLCAAISAFALSRSSQAGLGRLKGSPFCYPGALKLSYRVITESCSVLAWSLARALRGRPLEGSSRWVPFGPPCQRSELATDRAVMLTLMSFAPNDIVIEVDNEREQAHVHEIRPGGSPDQWRHP